MGSSKTVLEFEKSSRTQNLRGLGFGLEENWPWPRRLLALQWPWPRTCCPRTHPWYLHVNDRLCFDYCQLGTRYVLVGPVAVRCLCSGNVSKTKQDRPIVTLLWNYVRKLPLFILSLHSNLFPDAPRPRRTGQSPPSWERTIDLSPPVCRYRLALGVSAANDLFELARREGQLFIALETFLFDYFYRHRHLQQQIICLGVRLSILCVFTTVLCK